MGTWHTLQAAHVISRGGIVAYPTEAVYGLGCDPSNEQVLMRLVRLKQRSPEKGFILIAADIDQLLPYVRFTAAILKRIGPSWPGPVTWLVPAQTTVSPLLTGAHDTLAVRVTDHPVARSLCEKAGTALVSTSANRSGQLPARNDIQVRRMFGTDVDFILPGNTGKQKKPTEIRDARTGRVIRAG